ncbi:hypothetical protein [Paraburkholderia saeva]|uniref:Uncharacterized protein n=1 Tax=Paraburkholderia saeva TaxID=2777537 RepID=A0A9N8S137_9BURK|nr:hypothetical protein [Paraburkholderia saeva]CAG4926651.1 hypothetical protein LMG31841_05606 [Paraburkholderia saeva]
MRPGAEFEPADALKETGRAVLIDRIMTTAIRERDTTTTWDPVKKAYSAPFFTRFFPVRFHVFVLIPRYRPLRLIHWRGVGNPPATVGNAMRLARRATQNGCNPSRESGSIRTKRTGSPR